MLEEPPDRILALSTDSGMRVLLQMLIEHLACQVDACSPYQLIANPSLAIGALIVSNPGPLPEVLPVLPKDQTAIPIIYCAPNEHLEIVRRLPHPSLIAVVSISEYFLSIARGVLGPVVGQRHSLMERLLTGDTPVRTLRISCFAIRSPTAWCVPGPKRRARFSIASSPSNASLRSLPQWGIAGSKLPLRSPPEPRLLLQAVLAPSGRGRGPWSVIGGCAILNL